MLQIVRSQWSVTIVERASDVIKMIGPCEVQCHNVNVKYLSSYRKFPSQVTSFPEQVYWTCQTFIDNMEISFLFFLKRIYIIIDIQYI